MKRNIIASLGLIALVTPAFAQLKITSQSPTTFAAAVNASAADQLTLDTVGSTQPASITVNNLEFDLIPNPTNYVLGAGFYADISFVHRSEVDVDNIFLNSSYDDATIGLYQPYTDLSKSLSYHLTTGPGVTDVSFWLSHQDTSFGSASLYSQDNTDHALFYEGVDFAANTIYDFILWDDRGSVSYKDNNDGVLLIEENLNPVGLGDITPVPEPATYGLIGAALLGVAVIARKKKVTTSPIILS